MKTQYAYRFYESFALATTKAIKALALAFLLVTGFFACKPENAVPSAGHDTGQTRLAALPAPTVTSLNSVAACYNCPPNAPATDLPIPWVNQQNTLVVKGTNFGVPAGKVVATDLSGKNQTAFGFSVLSWKDTEIQLQAGAALTATPTGIKISITTADNRSVSTSFTGIPMISGRIYNTPPYYTNLRRIQMGLQPQPNVAGNVYTSSLDDTYTPQKGDIWWFPGGQASVITSLNSSSQTISQNKASKIERVTYNVTNAEWVNGSGVSVGNGFVYEVTTTYFSNAPNRVSTKLITKPASAFTSAIVSAGYARTYYR